jgi:hypothetical protein
VPIKDLIIRIQRRTHDDRRLAALEAPPAFAALRHARPALFVPDAKTADGSSDSLPRDDRHAAPHDAARRLPDAATPAAHSWQDRHRRSGTLCSPPEGCIASRPSLVPGNTQIATELLRPNPSAAVPLPEIPFGVCVSNLHLRLGESRQCLRCWSVSRCWDR